jgi:hypothetical protein
MIGDDYVDQAGECRGEIVDVGTDAFDRWVRDEGPLILGSVHGAPVLVRPIGPSAHDLPVWQAQEPMETSI